MCLIHRVTWKWSVSVDWLYINYLEREKLEAPKCITRRFFPPYQIIKLTSDPGAPLQPERPGKPASPWRGKPGRNMFKQSKGNLSCAAQIIRHVTHLASINSISSPLTFVSLKKKEVKREWKRVKMIELSFLSCYRAGSIPNCILPCSLWVLFHPTDNATSVSHSHFKKIMQKPMLALVQANHVDNTFSPLGPRSP